MAGGGNRGRCRGKTPGARPNRRGRGLGVRLSRRFTSRPARTVPPGAMNYYERLQVDRKASPEVIKSAYRVLLKDIHGHPDLGGDEENTKAINEAYEVLGDPRLRGQYDRELALADRFLNPPPTLHPPQPMAGGEGHLRAFRLGMFLFEKGLLDRALREMQAAVRLKPSSATYRY